MGKKIDKATVSKKAKAEKLKFESFLENLRPTTGKSERARGKGNTRTETSKPAVNDKTKKAIAFGIVALALGALPFLGLNMTSTHASDDPVVQETAPAAIATKQQQPARAASEAAAASMLPQALAPKKARLAEPSKSSNEVAKPSKTNSKKSAKLTTKNKSKETVKKSVVSAKKQKAKVNKSKNTLAAKNID